VTLSNAQLAHMRSAQAVLMGDTCQIGTFSAGTADAFGRPAASYSYATAIACGFEWQGTNEAHTAIMTEANADAMLRVPHTTSLSTQDRVKLTYRYGVDITDLVFEVVGVGRRGSTGTLVLLRQVTA
jgi:hypothetical protein